MEERVTRRKREKRETKFLVKADFKGLEKGEERPPARAYLFSPSGELLDSKPLDVEGQAPLKTDYGFGERGRFQVVVGPETEEIRRLRDFRARTQMIHVDLGSEVKVPFEIFKPDWGCWFGIIYHIMGDVKKEIVADADTTVYAPICNAEVEIYEVDYHRCIVTLPDSIIEKIREELLRRIWRWPPEVIPLPKVIPTPEVIPPPPPPPPVETRPRLMEWSSGASAASESPMSEARLKTSSAAEWVPGISFAEIQSAPTARFRQLLLEKAVVFKPLMCLWFSHLFCYTVTSLGTTHTDATGHFQKSIVFWCPTEEPDLYFVVRQTIGGTLKNVYAPRPIPCYTYWNYKSGTNVTLIVTDPDAYACFDPVPADRPGLYVMPLGIGWDGWYDVQQAHIKPPAVVDPNRGLYKGTDPYGTRLDIQMQFHDGLRGAGVWYYRWSYRKEGTTGWTDINTPIIHRYLTMVAGKPAIVADDLGPNTVGAESHLFLVPDPIKDWVIINRDDRAFAIWHTSGLEDGKYELRLQMFDAAGNKVTPAAAGFKYFLPTGPVATGVWPVDDALHVETDGSIILHLHIDNSDTVADIQSVALGGVAAAECQFLEYQNKLTDSVVLTYVAYHPNGFLDHYDLAVKRGISGVPVASMSSTTPASAPTTQSFPVNDLLQQVVWQGKSYGPYSQCAFAVELHTWPRTRDGYYRIRAYEAHDTSAFALVAKTS